MKKIATLLLLLVSACKDDVQLTHYCEHKVACWLPEGDENNQSNIIFEIDSYKYEGRPGFCNTGITVCEEDEIRCEGVKYPTQELCDGKDNDCNGIIDDPEKLWAGIANTKCYFEEIGECRYSEQACINGELICLYDTAPNFGPEICDGRDNDCDGEYDEDVESRLVYNGALETVNIGECRAGITRCINGHEEIYGMVLPHTEICANGKDDDCDGLEDESESGLASVDYAFIIDFSGSMQGDRLDSVLDSVCSFVGNPIFINSRFAMIAISVGSIGNANNYDPLGFYLISDFADIASTCQSLTEFVNQTIFGIADEYQLDAVINSFASYSTSVSLNWSDRQKKVYIFSDEQPQTIYDNLEDRLYDFVDLCMENNFDVGIFTLPYLLTSGWDTLLVGCGGFIEDIDNLQNDTYFRDHYLIWFGGSC